MVCGGGCKRTRKANKNTPHSYVSNVPQRLTKNYKNDLDLNSSTWYLLYASIEHARECRQLIFFLSTLQTRKPILSTEYSPRLISVCPAQYVRDNSVLLYLTPGVESLKWMPESPDLDTMAAWWIMGIIGQHPVSIAVYQCRRALWGRIE